MGLTVYNTLTRNHDRFAPIDPNHVRMYVCGPTVYDRAHIGNARPVVVFDTLYRLLKRLYPKVTYARNITDVGRQDQRACGGIRPLDSRDHRGDRRLVSPGHGGAQRPPA